MISKIRIQFLARGVLGARDLAEALKASQPTVSRGLAQMGATVLRLGRGPATRYGLAAPVGGCGHSWPLYLIDPQGAPRELSVLHSLAGPAWWLESHSPWESLTGGDFPDGIFPGLPWFLDDLRPQGFLGRAFARKHGTALGAGRDPSAWPERAVAESLLRFGGDLPGAFVLGREALAAALRLPVGSAIPEESRRKTYPQLAEEALAGGLAGSSAGGEQPKFTAVISKPEGAVPVIVKFSPPMATPAGRRWADLLAAEAIANSVLAGAGFETARNEWLDAGGRRFLEVTRFDRTPQGGRIPFVSLKAHDAAFFGEMDTPWDKAAARLESGGWLAGAEAARLASLWRFGRLIANTDMHYGNASLLLGERRPLRLAPPYDMLPMAYRPGPENSIPGVFDRMALARPAEAAGEPERALAAEFWERVSTSGHISKVFREIASAHAKWLRG
jgi:hypothetical protein